MAKWAIVFGAILFAMGLWGYFGGDSKPAGETADSATASQTEDVSANDDSGSKSSKKTALIPSLFGCGLLLCGTLGLDERMRKHAMHAAALVATLGFLGGAVRIIMTAGKLMETGPSRATWFVIAMTVLCAVYVAMSIQSFRQALGWRDRQLKPAKHRSSYLAAMSP
ncbi:MAG: hypothetical protein R3C03_15860 [Pirellulaceae bacterium]